MSGLQQYHKMDHKEMPNIMPDFCTICGDKASRWRYSHYGATSCFSCRTFYRRSVEKNKFQKYKCRSTTSEKGSCVVTVKTRKKCAFCRFQKCRRVGMKHGDIKSGQKPRNPDDIENIDKVSSGDESFPEAVKSPDGLNNETTETGHNEPFEPDESATGNSTNGETVPVPPETRKPRLVYLESLDTGKAGDISSTETRFTRNQKNEHLSRADADNLSFPVDEFQSESEVSPSVSPGFRKTFPPHSDDVIEEEEHSRNLAVIPNYNLNMNLTVEESLKIKALLQTERESLLGLRDLLPSFGSSMKQINQFMTSVLTGRPLEFSAMCWGYACGIQKLTRFSLALPEFVEATGNDETTKKNILVHNIDPMFNIRNAFFFQSDASSIICQLERFGIFDFSLLKSCFERFFESSALVPMAGIIAPMKWKQYFVTPWADSLEQEQKYEYLMSSLHKLSLNNETTCLLSVIALFSTKHLHKESINAPLENFRKHQHAYSLLLYRYLVHTRGQQEASKIYPGFISTLEILREMSEILKNKTIKIGPSPNIEEQLSMFFGCP